MAAARWTTALSGLRHGAVPRGSRRGHRDVVGHFFAGLDADVLHLAVFHHHAAAFVERVGAGNLVPIFLDGHLDAGRAALFFVIGGQKNDVAREPRVGALELDHRGDVGGEHGLVVDRAAAVHVAVANVRREGIHGPLFRIHADRVLVRDQQQGIRRVGKRAGLQARDDDAPPRSHFQHFVRDAFFLENGGNIFCDRGLIARRIHGIDADHVAEPALGFIGQLAEIGLRHGRLRPRACAGGTRPTRRSR